MRECGIKVVVDFLDILAVVAVVTGQAVEPLLQNWVVGIPQSQGEAKGLLLVTKTGQSVFASAVRLGSGMVVR